MSRKKPKSVVLIYLMIFTIISFMLEEACNTQVQASSLFMGEGQPKVVMISLDHIEIQDFAEDAFLSDILDRSASAYISCRVNGKPSASKAKLTIGSGRRLLVQSNIIRAVNYPALQTEYDEEQLTGIPGNVIYPEINNLKRCNKTSEYYHFIGYLGDQMNALDKTVYIIGNSDTEVMNRNNMLIVMDSNGIVDGGDVENTVLYDESFPGGIRTDFARLEELYLRNVAKSDLIMIDTGDLARLEYYQKKLPVDRYQELKKQALVRISAFIRNIIDKNQEDTIFIFFSAYPSAENISVGYKMTPIIIYGNHEKGLLYSKSTRREGIITSLDISDYVIGKLSSSRSPIKEIKNDNPIETMLLLKKHLLNTSVLRLPVLTSYALFEIICAVLGLLFALNTRLVKSGVLKAFVKTTMLVNIAAPAILLYLAAIYIESITYYLTALLIGGYGIAIILNQCFKSAVSRFASAALLVNASLMLDLLRNSALIKSSVFGYDPIIGARFYGIGNEFAGVYIGSSILLAGCLFQRFQHEAKKNPAAVKLLLLIYFALQLYILGMPTKGANFGAAIAAICGYYFFYHSLFCIRIKGKHILFLGIAITAVISLIIFIDLRNIGETSHVGMFIRDIEQNGIQVLLSTFGRKLAMNLKLIKYTIWTKVLLCIILIITIMFFKPVRLLRSIFKKYRHLSSAWLGISAASIAGLIANDSGIVMAATAMIFTGYTILYMCLEVMEAG